MKGYGEIMINYIIMVLHNTLKELNSAEGSLWHQGKSVIGFLSALARCYSISSYN